MIIGLELQRQYTCGLIAYNYFQRSLSFVVGFCSNISGNSDREAMIIIECFISHVAS
jgi:hypothetical protein